MSVAVGIAAGIVPPPPPPPPPEPKGPVQPPVDLGPQGPGDFPPGPLESGWELVHTIIVPFNPKASRATLQKKDAGGGPPGSKPGPKAPKLIRSAPPRTFTSAKGVKTVPMGPASDKKTLRIKERWVDKEANLNIWVIDIDPSRMVYEDGTTWKIHALHRNSTSIYNDGGPNGREIKPIPAEPVDPNSPEPPVEEKKKLSHIGPDRDKEFEKRKESNASDSTAAPAAADSAKGAKGAPALKGAPAPNVAHPANQEKRPLSKEEQVQQLKETIGNLQTSEKFKNVPKKDRDQLNKLLGPGAKKQ